MDNLTVWAEDYLDALQYCETEDDDTNLVYAVLEAFQEEVATGVSCDC